MILYLCNFIYAFKSLFTINLKYKKSNLYTYLKLLRRCKSLKYYLRKFYILRELNTYGISKLVKPVYIRAKAVSTFKLRMKFFTYYTIISHYEIFIQIKILEWQT